jgi:hypothetical protein
MKTQCEAIREALVLRDGGAGETDIADALRDGGLDEDARAYELRVHGFDSNEHATLATALETRPDDFKWTERETEIQTSADDIMRRLEKRLRVGRIIRVVTHRELEHKEGHYEEFSLAAFIEQLRYAGVVRVHRNDDDGMCIDIFAPAGITDEVGWARRNAERMQSHHWNAVVAPPFSEEDRT